MRVFKSERGWKKRSESEGNVTTGEWSERWDVASFKDEGKVSIWRASITLRVKLNKKEMHLGKNYIETIFKFSYIQAEYCSHRNCRKIEKLLLYFLLQIDLYLNIFTCENILFLGRSSLGKKHKPHNVCQNFKLQSSKCHLVIVNCVFCRLSEIWDWNLCYAKYYILHEKSKFY